MTTFLRKPFLNHPVGIASDSYTASVLPQGGQLTKVKALRPLTTVLSCLQTRLTNFTPHLPKCVTMCLLTILSLGSLVLTTACTAIPSAGRSIYESPDTVVRLEPVSKISFAGDGNSHPASLARDQIDVLLTSISALKKVGILRSFIGTRGTPRLFDRTDIDLLASPIRDALAKAGPGEAVIFYRLKNRIHGRAQVTSGVLFVHDNVVVLYVANFWHPVITLASEVGSKERLGDVRETAVYVRDYPWVSVGEQDFAIFFVFFRYQLSRQEHSLWHHPERTVEITYLPYLEENADPIKRAQESEEAVRQATLPEVESQAITNLKKRLLDLEQKNAVLSETIHNLPITSIPSNNHSARSSQRQTQQVSPEKLVEIMEGLKNRIAELEQQIPRKSPRPGGE